VKTGNSGKYRAVFAAAGSVLSFLIFLAVLQVWKGPAGFDIYYYALQTVSLSLGKELLFSDRSAVYGVLYILNLVVKNPLLSVQILSAASAAIVYFCLLYISFRGGASLYKTAAATLSVFNPAVFYLMLEFTKNSFAFALFFLAFVFLSDEKSRFTFNLNDPLSALKFFSGFLFLAASVLSHRVMLIPAFCFAAHSAAVFMWGYVRQRKLKVRKKVLIPAGIFLCAALSAGAVLLKNKILERLPAFDITAPLHRMVQLNTGRLLAGERIFYIFMQIAVCFLVPPVLIKKRQFYRPEFVFALIGWIFLFPFLRFSWDETGFRLLILTPLVMGPWLLKLESPSSSGLFFRIAGIVFIAGSVLFTVESARNLRFKGPDYTAYARDLGSLEKPAKGRRVIAHRGLAGFLWYEKGIWSENFIAAPGEEDKYLRLVYAFSPEIFEPYLAEGDPPPVSINKTYTLMEEYIWQRFYQDRQGLYFLKSELNPWLPRPGSGFVINRKTAGLMSPVALVP
jgi:hypothetical protein